jgi:propanol-preferring alcohol dehydrogenase
MHAQLLHTAAPITASPLQWTGRPDPQPGPRQIAIRVSACAVCHTDLHTVEGELSPPRLPIIPGHQVVGEVVARGPDASGWSIGERAGVFWVYKTCGRCAFCRRGEENLCPAAEFTGLHRNGGYAEYILAQADFALRIPDAFDDVHAAPLLCAGIIGYRSLRKAEVQPGETVGLFGFGASAHLAIQVARYWNCRVFVFTRSPSHRDHALSLGAEWTGGASDPPPTPLDRAVIFAPSGALVPAALAHLRPGGTLAINAISMTDIPPLPYPRIYGERTLRSVANATRRDAAEFLQLAAGIPIQVTVQTFGLKEANRVLYLLKESKLDGAAVLVP